MGSSSALADQDDTALVTLVADGDAAALEELYGRHAPWLVARLMRRCNDSDVVARRRAGHLRHVWKDARRFRGDGEVAGWLWGIAFRRMVSRLRSRKDVVLLPEWDAVGRGQRARGRGRGAARGGVRRPGRRRSPALPEFRSVVQACVLDGLTTKEAGDCSASARTP